MSDKSFSVPHKTSVQRATHPALPQVDQNHSYEIPTKLIKTPEDMKIWDKSEAYYEYLGFILAINDAVKGKSNSKGSENISAEVVRVVNLLEQLDQQINKIPPVQQPQRFGNVAFRTWCQNLKDDSLLLLEDMLPEKLYASIPEIVNYLVDGFGNSTRIDYGTGHEISFLMFICCLFKIGYLKDHDKLPTGCTIFPKYLSLVQKLQQAYRMEPAGSHGVWSLDDYQFVPFIWGSSQLFAHPQIEPAQFLLPNILNKYASDYLFLTCIKYINTVKTGPFAEHSNQLWSISGVASWSKINGGLIKMYKAEVLAKFPVVQHIVFGSLFTLKPVEHVMGMMSGKTSMVAPPVPPIKLSSQSSSSSDKEVLRVGHELKTQSVEETTRAVHDTKSDSEFSSPNSQQENIREVKSGSSVSSNNTEA